MLFVLSRCVEEVKKIEKFPIIHPRKSYTADVNLLINYYFFTNLNIYREIFREIINVFGNLNLIWYFRQQTANSSSTWKSIRNFGYFIMNITPFFSFWMDSFNLFSFHWKKNLIMILIINTRWYTFSIGISFPSFHFIFGNVIDVRVSYVYVCVMLNWW